MTTREDIAGIRNHPVWDEIDNVRQRGRDATPRDSTDRETLARIEAVLSYAANYRSFGPHLFPSSWSSSFANLLSYVNQVSSLLESWDQSGPMSRGTAGNIDSYLDNVLDVLVTFASLQKESRARAIADAADGYRSAAEASIKAIETKVSELQAALVSTQETLDSTLQEATAARSTAETAKQELADTLASADDAARSALEERVQKFDSRSKARYNELSQEADEVIAGLHLKEDEAKDLLQIVADASVAGGYQKYATREQKAFRIWNILGLSIAGLVAIYLAVRFWDINELTVQESILRAAISLPGLAAAAYCLRQASLRQREAIEAKYRELDLIALPPFTDSMSEDQKSELRMLLGTRIFGKSVQQAADGVQVNPLAGISLDDLTKLVQAIRT